MAVESAGDEGVFFDDTFFCAGDGYVVDFEGAAQGAFIVGFGFGEIGKGAKLGALRGDQVALSENDVVHGGGAKLVLLICSASKVCC